MSNCLRIQILEYDANCPAQYLDNGLLFLDLFEGELAQTKERIPSLGARNEIGSVGTLGFSVPNTSKNIWILQRKITPNAWEKDKTPIKIAAFDGSRVLNTNGLSVVQESEEGYEIELVRTQDDWIKAAEDLPICEILFDEYTVNKQQIVNDFWNSWSIYNDGDLGINWLFGWFGRWSQEPITNDSNQIYQPIGLGDLRLVHSLYALLKKGFCQLGYVFESPVLETEWGRRLWAYLLDEDFNNSKGLLDNLRFSAKIETPIDGITFNPSNVVGEIITFEVENFDYPSHYDNTTGIYTPGPLVADLNGYLTFELIDADQEAGFQYSIYVIVAQNFGNDTVWNQLFQVSTTGGEGTVVTLRFSEKNMVFSDGSWLGSATVRILQVLGGTWRITDGLFYNVPKRRTTIQEGDIIEAGSLMDCDITFLDLIKAASHLISGIPETDYVNKKVILRQPYIADVYEELDIEGFFKDDQVIDITDIQQCDTEIGTNKENRTQRYCLLSFKRSNDEAIKALQLPENETLHSKLVDNGPNYISGTAKKENPVFEPTLNDKVEGVTRNNVPIDLPHFLDNDDGEVSKKIGNRILFFAGAVEQWIGVPAQQAIFEDLLVEGETTVMPYFFQKANAAIDQLGTIPEMKVIYGEDPYDLYTMFWRRYLKQILTFTEVEALFFFNALRYCESNFRALYKYSYFGRDAFGRLQEKSNFSVCSDNSTNVILLPEEAVPFCSDEENQSTEECANQVAIESEQVGSCFNFSFSGQITGTIDTIQWEYRLLSESTWTDLGNGNTASVCDAGGPFIIRLTITFVEENCGTVILYSVENPCGDAPVCNIEPIFADGVWCFLFTVENVECEFEVNEAYYQINDGAIIPFTYGQIICGFDYLDVVEVVATVTFLNECSACPPVQLRCTQGLPTRNDENRTCEYNEPVLECIPVIVEGQNCYDFQIGGTILDEISTFIVVWSCDDGTEGTWMVGDGPVCCSGQITAYAIVMFCDCPNICTPVITCDGGCTTPTIGDPINAIICSGAFALRDTLFPNADSGGTFEFLFFDDNCDGSSSGSGSNIPNLVGDNPIVNFSNFVAGCYHFRYSLGSGDCAISGDAIVQVPELPNAGIGQTVDICENSGLVNLFNLLTGSPDTNGEFTLSNNTGYSNNGTANDPTDDYIDTGVAPVGSITITYTVQFEPDAGYTVISACPDDTATIIVNILACASCTEDVGGSNSIEVCASSGCSIDLFDFVTGTPSTGGTWTQISGTSQIAISGSSGTVSFAGVVSGVYAFEYSVANLDPDCEDVAVITVIVRPVPYAGSAVPLSGCDNDSAINLFDGLSGLYTQGGSWQLVPSLPSGTFNPATGVINPQSGDAGTYTATYTVSNAQNGPCAANCIDSEAVTLTINAGCEAGGPATELVCLSGTGSPSSITVNAVTMLGGTAGSTFQVFGFSANCDNVFGQPAVFSINGGPTQAQNGVTFNDGDTLSDFQNEGCLLLIVRCGTAPCDDTALLTIQVNDCGQSQGCTSSVAIEEVSPCVIDFQAGNPVNCAGGDIEVQVWTGTTWVAASGNNSVLPYTGNDGNSYRVKMTNCPDCPDIFSNVVTVDCAPAGCSIAVTFTYNSALQRLEATWNVTNGSGSVGWQFNQMANHATPCSNATGVSTLCSGTGGDSGSANCPITPPTVDTCYRFVVFTNGSPSCQKVEFLEITGAPCAASVVISEANTNCIYRAYVENPDNGTKTARFTVFDDDFNAVLLEVDCVHEDSCNGGEISRTLISTYGNTYAEIYAPLVIGATATDIQIHDGSGWTLIDISSAGTYTGNGPAFRQAVETAVRNGLLAAFPSLTEGVNYLFYVNISPQGEIEVTFYNKRNPSGTLLYATTLIGTGTSQSVLSTGGGGTRCGTSTDMPTSLNHLWDCGFNTPCGYIATGESSAIGVNNICRPREIDVTNASIFGNEGSGGCTLAELTATVSGCTGTPVYSWVGPNGFTSSDQVVQVPNNSGTYTVTVTGCEGCGPLTDSITT